MMMQPQSYVVRFGTQDETRVSTFWQPSRTRAIDLANAISLVLLGKHGFKSAHCHVKNRQENELYFVEYVESQEPYRAKRNHHGAAVV